MTAEIAILNKEAIALAADSAVTLETPRGQKVFLSAMKIFALSRRQPVGIMVYGSAEFMGVPWESIVKIYRSHLGSKEFACLTDYTTHFFDFLCKSGSLFPKAQQEAHFKNALYGYYYLIAKNIDDETRRILQRQSYIRDSQIGRIASRIIAKCDRWVDATMLPPVSGSDAREFARKHASLIEHARKDLFGKMPLTHAASGRLLRVGAKLFFKLPATASSAGTSGVVIAGFGTNDVFPRLRSFYFDSMIDGHLKYSENPPVDVHFDMGAAVVPFAQHEMVFTFVEGVDPNYQSAIESDLYAILSRYSRSVLSNTQGLTRKRRLSLRSKLERMNSDLVKRYRKELKEYRHKKHVNPIIRIVAALPKDELAAMAESLVNLTSLKRKVSLEAETVAGPIDVAVISKGDGFIWIKRKHYFEPRLNPQFFAKYHQERENASSS